MAPEQAQLQPLDLLNLRDHIEQQVRNAILNGLFKPGDRLVETTIADQLSVSRAPVREALSALEREGIVVSIPRRGYFVIEFTDKDIEEIYSLRLLLEIGALRRAINRITSHDIAEMQLIVDKLGEAVHQQRDLATIIALDLSFHEFICRQADHSRLYSAWNSMRWQTWMLIGLTSTTHYNYPDQPKELHQLVLDAIRQQDLKQAEACLGEHILDAQRRAGTALQSLRSSG